MLNGSRGDSTSVTKYPYVSPLPEAPSRLECYWYVDVSSRTGTIGAPFESIMSAANTSHPFSIPFSVFLPDCLCLCMSSWLPKAKIGRGCLSPIPGGDSGEVSEYMGHAWVPTSLVCLSVSFSSFLLLIFPSSAVEVTHERPRCHEQVVARRRKGSPDSDFRNFISSRPFDRTGVRPSSFFSSLKPLSPFFICLRITELISILLSVFTRRGSRLGISGGNELFPCVPWINRRETFVGVEFNSDLSCVLHVRKRRALLRTTDVSNYLNYLLYICI